MRKATRLATRNTDHDLGRFSGGVVDAGHWPRTNPLDRLVDVLERAVARTRPQTMSSDLTGT